MGGNCSFSQSFVPNANVPGQTKDVLALSLELGLNRRDVNGLYRYESQSDMIFFYVLFSMTYLFYSLFFLFVFEQEFCD